MNHSIPCMAAAAAIVMSGWAATGARAQGEAAYPSKPIHLVVGYAPGGGTDIMARLIGQHIGVALGQPVVVENKPGAGQNIAASYVARSPADGYTLFLSSSALAVNISLYNKLDYDPVKSFAPVAVFAQSPNLMVVPASLGVSTVDEFVAYAKKGAQGVNFSSSGAGSSQHLGGELFRQETGIQASHVPYKGSAPSIVAILSGEVQYTFINIPSVMAVKSNNRMRVLAITSAKRSPLMPNVPTMAEAGMPHMTMAAWYGVLAPAGTPPQIVNRLNAAINKAVADPAFRERMQTEGAETMADSPDYFKRFLADDIARWRQVVKTGNVKVE
ncbi:Tripartite-type tricarboxylate transporter, receptor component TctC [Cupriavidus sp. YR651]|uniref:tripartite tricarboxylate transporter substrate binding protein n=1 Tax=Cupriavidus sp. YR651 TaxID=1855315 RepID=UPI00088EF6F1|nr:tripartite tricarboxylate transporter substrate binding protein [Cupriavidus sp. YR651]SDB98285.1 Tripartite-type tricarboxylate transporter, receptor component TctC [Cupriavidus sp. YR651]